MSLPVRLSPDPRDVAEPYPARAQAPKRQSEQTSIPLGTTPHKKAKMTQSSRGSSPLSSPPSSPPAMTSAIGCDPPVQRESLNGGIAQSVQPNEGSTPIVPSTSECGLEHPVTKVSGATPASIADPATKSAPKRTDQNDDDAAPPLTEAVAQSAATANPDGTSQSVRGVSTPEVALGMAADERASESKQITKKKASRKPAAPRPTSSNRPTRTRKAPERLDDYQELQAPKSSPIQKGASKVFDPTYITTNSTSRLVKADVYHLLLEGPAWTSLTTAQQKTLISMLPANAISQAQQDRIEAGETEGTRPDAFTMSNDCFRTDVAKFKADLKNGHLAKTWQAAAEQAVLERAAGEYDEWKAEEAELWWGQKSK